MKTYDYPGSKEHKVGRLLVDRFDDELAIIERNVTDLRPGETNLGRQSENKEQNLIFFFLK